MPIFLNATLWLPQVDAAEFEAFFDRHLTSYGEADNNALIDWFAELAEKVGSTRMLRSRVPTNHNHRVTILSFVAASLLFGPVRL